MLTSSLKDKEQKSRCDSHLWSHVTESIHSNSQVWKHGKFLCILHSTCNYIPLRNICLVLMFKVNGVLVEPRKYRKC